jgi:hypothetical protein
MGGHLPILGKRCRGPVIDGQMPKPRLNVSTSAKHAQPHPTPLPVLRIRHGSRLPQGTPRQGLRARARRLHLRRPQPLGPRPPEDPIPRLIAPPGQTGAALLAHSVGARRLCALGGGCARFVHPFAQPLSLCCTGASCTCAHKNRSGPLESIPPCTKAEPGVWCAQPAKLVQGIRLGSSSRQAQVSGCPSAVVGKGTCRLSSLLETEPN